MSRKYRHRGYQDNDWDRDRDRDYEHRNGKNRGGGFLDDQPQRSSRDPRERTGRKPTERDQRDEVFRCHICGQTVPDPASIEKDDQCPNCSAALRCCRSCAWFDPQARWECRKNEDIPKRIKRKDAPNECERFKPRMVLDTSGRSKSTSGFFNERDETGRKAFEALFGDD